MSNQVYSFPLLKLSEILQCIREMQIPMTEEDLQTGNAPALRRIFEVFIEVIMGLTKEEMSQPAFSGLNALNYPELHDDSIPELTFFRAVQKMLFACGVYDFSFRDLFSPDPKRVRRHLSALINFAKFREERTMAFSDLTNQTEDLMNKKQHAEEEQARYLAKLNTLKQEQKSEEPAIQQLTEECEDLKSEINQLNKKQAVLRHETTELKNYLRELNDQMVSKDYEIQTKLDGNAKLKSQIVNSPERVKKEIQDSAATLNENRGELNTLERKEREKGVLMENIQRTKKDLDKIFRHMQDTEGQMIRFKASKKEFKEKTQSIEERKIELEETTSQIQRLKRLLHQKQEAFKSQKNQHNLTKQATQEALQLANQEVQELQSRKADTEEKLQKMLRQIEKLTVKRNEEAEHHKNMTNEILKAHQCLHQNVQNYDQAILSHLSTDHNISMISS